MRTCQGVAGRHGARRLNAHLQAGRRERVAILAARPVVRRFRRALLGDRQALPLPHPQPPRAAGAGKAQASGGCRSRWTPTPCRRRRSVLVGRHDFTTFRSVQCQANSPLRTLDRLDVTRSGDLIEVSASARSFLHNQVRSMVGTLKRVGEGGWTPATSRRRSTPRIAPPAAWLRRPTGFISSRSIIPAADPEHSGPAAPEARTARPATQGTCRRTQRWRQRGPCRCTALVNRHVSTIEATNSDQRQKLEHAVAATGR